MKKLKNKKIRLITEQMGFSLLEVLVSVGILAALGVGLISAVDTNYKATGILDEQATAVNLATSLIEAIQDTSYAMDYSLSDPPLNTVAVPANYSVSIETECSVDGDSFEPCTGSANQTLQLIEIKIIHDGKPVIRLCTYKTDL